MYKKKYMSLVSVLKHKIRRAKEKVKDLEVIVSQGGASSIQKQEYLQWKAKIEAWEDAVDLAEGMIEEQTE